MRPLLLRLIGITAAIVAAVLVWIVATLPPAAIRPAQPPRPADRVTGAYHIHSSRSDGSGTADEIAAAAARAGLQFVIITDHGDAMRPADPPAYRHGVLVIDAVEVSSTGGHVVALGLRTPAPYPLAGEPRDVIEDIHRLGGWAVAAHPDSPKPALRWRPAGVLADGIEWFNVDSEWRDHTPGQLAAAAMRAMFRPAESVASLFQWPAQSLRRWDAALNRQSMFSLAAVDAHARLGDDTDGGAPSRLSVAFPGYETMFRTVAQTVALEHPLTGDATADAAAVIAAIVAGRSYSVMRALIDAPFALDFSASSAQAHAEIGGTLSGPGPYAFRAAVPPGTGATLVLVQDGRDVESSRDLLAYETSSAGAFRLEARLNDRAVPWIVSNVIRTGGEVAAEVTRPAGEEPEWMLVSIPLGSWTVEASPSSTGTVVVDGAELRLHYRLGPGAPAGQFAAIASAASGNTPVERIEFTASSRLPVRISVQARLPGPGDQRWQKSVYLDQAPRRISVALEDFLPVDRSRQLRPIAARLQSILLVIDTLNTLPGTDGDIVFRDVAYVAGRPAADSPPRAR